MQGIRVLDPYRNLRRAMYLSIESKPSSVSIYLVGIDIHPWLSYSSWWLLVLTNRAWNWRSLVYGLPVRHQLSHPYISRLMIKSEIHRLHFSFWLSDQCFVIGICIWIMLQKHELQNRSEIERRLKSIVDGFVDKHREELSPKDEITESMIS